MRVLTFLHYYLPGYKSGGPLRTIQGMVDYLSPEIEFSIVTLNRDDTVDAEPYPDISTGQWTSVGNSRICYLPKISRAALAEPLAEGSWDVLYLQSFFNSNFTIRPLLWWKLGLLSARHVLLAPRGEFSSGAISIKARKKRIFIKLAELAHLYHDIYWQASSVYERDDILREIPSTASPERILIAPDVPPKPSPQVFSESAGNRPTGDRLRIAFLSRITEKKNLDYAIRVLQGVTDPVEFNIYGPNDRDPTYWRVCSKLLRDLPDHVTSHYHGPIEPDRVPAMFASHDLFLFPTRGENFGHVIFEALQAGCPVLLSDQTPWQELREKKLSWVVPLSDLEGYRQVISHLYAEPVEQRLSRRTDCRDYVQTFMEQSDILAKNRQMFRVLQ